MRRGGRAWLVIAAAVAAAAAGLVVTSGAAGGRPAGPAVGGAMPALLSGAPARGVGTDLVLGGDAVWRVGAGQPRTAGGGWLSGRLGRLPGSSGGTQVNQLLPVPGGVVAVLAHSSSPPGTGRTAGPVLFIPWRAGPARLIARASMVAMAPGGRAVWLQTATSSPAGPPAPSATPVMSPTFAVSPAGRRVSPVLRLPLGLIAASSSGLLTESVVTGQLQLWDPATGRPQRLRLPDGAQVVGAGGGLVIWQPRSCLSRCRVHLTDLRAGGAITIPLPAGWWPVRYQEPVASDASGQRLVIPLDRVGTGGYPAAEDLYVIDLAARAMRQVPGGPYAAPQPPGLGDPGVTLASAWDQRGRLWVLAGSGDGYFQLGYWAGTGPLRVYPPMRGNPVAISAPGPARHSASSQAYHT